MTLNGFTGKKQSSKVKIIQNVRNALLDLITIIISTFQLNTD